MNSLKNTILDDENLRWCEIYKITCLENNKIYVGQSVSHILNHKRYRPYGMIGRFNSHVSEALGKKKNQSAYLNNAIRKYGKENFIIELIEECNISDSNIREQYYIKEFNSLYPNGYNLNSGGKNFEHTKTSKERVSIGVINYYKEKKFERLKDITNLPDNYEKLIKPTFRDKKQFGWYIYFGNNKKVEFGGVHINIESSKQMCFDFLKELKERITAKHLDAGTA